MTTTYYTPARRAAGHPAFCGGCCDGPLDLDAILAAVRLGTRYVHRCGKILMPGAP